MQGEDTARKHNICLLILRPLGWLHTAEMMTMMMVSVGKNEQKLEPSSDAVGAIPTVEHYMVISQEFLHRNSIFSNNLIMKTQTLEKCESTPVRMSILYNDQRVPIERLGMNKRWHLHSMKYHLFLKRKFSDLPPRGWS